MSTATVADLGPPAEQELDDFGAAWPGVLNDIGRQIFAPSGRVSLAEWAESTRLWPDQSPYRIDQTPHVRELMEAYSDPAVEEFVVVKPSQAGVTEALPVNAVGYHIDREPRALLIVIPSVDEAEKWSKKKLQPMLDATPELQGKLEEGSRKQSNTILEKTYPGGSVGIIGSNSGRGFRMVTVGTVLSDDVDGWDVTAGKGKDNEGDQVALIRRRTDRIADRKLAWISTPTRPKSRISRLYHEMQRSGELHVPCPHCGAMQVLRWGGPDEPFGIKWETEDVGPGYELAPGEILRESKVHRPATAYYLCEANGCVIEEKDKPWMEARGEYLAEDGLPVRLPGYRKLGYWMHGALTITMPGSEWPKLVEEFLNAVDHPETLRGFVNLVLAEEYQEKGEAPDWRRLYERREPYPLGTCPEGVEFITVGGDVQANRIEAFVWGWGYDKERWFIEHVVAPGDTFDQKTWGPMTALLHRMFPKEAGGELPVARFAMDCNFRPEAAIQWARDAGDPRIMLVRGDPWRNWTVIVGSPSRSDVTLRGKKTGLQLWPIGGALIKQELYGSLRLNAPVEGEPYPPGYTHLPMIEVELCKQLVAEDLVTTTDRRGFTKREWVKNRHRNEMEDGFGYARGAAEQVGLSRMKRPGEQKKPKRKPKEADRPRDRGPGGRGGKGWLGRGGRGGGWLKR